ncbi:MBL fold metallo-hydrolase [Elizabethkingia miricola]|uniref:MBL fold metallo-hydrolase n=1 Tax=Elizabethkingia bruuniana TaxID=1756149 RepID=UPI00099AAE77|nr:MBL fold metallo-hydrolase [Elizabethkingia bruuniana]OPC66415.1 MBL fold metallo-hydrolase [Elizabethkingia bruuniana]RBI91587.1 MBL fold metallo-hydrolase [Elizabethkingia miricola]
MRLKFLGTGTSQGVPTIGCTDPVCLSENPKDKRLRSSVLVTTDDDRKILIDCGPDFRQQMLTQQEHNVDAVLLTHEHNDHVIGLDDMRPIIFRNKKDMPIYCRQRTGDEVKKRFPYAFSDEKYPGAPSFEMHFLDNRPFKLLDTEIVPIEITHYKIDIFGYKFKNTAYITDASAISDMEKDKLRNLDYFIINCLRKDNPHPAHFILPQILELVEELKPKQTYLTHLSHHIGFHDEMNQELPSHIQLAFDGQEIVF